MFSKFRPYNWLVLESAGKSGLPVASYKNNILRPTLHLI